MADIKFGINSLSKPIPAKTTKRLGVMAFILSSLSGIIGTLSFIPAGVSTNLQQILSWAASLCLGLIPFYGVDTTEKEIPIEKATVIETDSKN